MRNTLPLLSAIPFPPLTRGRLETVQANLGYRCNQACRHCHVDAGPKRSEQMSWATMQVLLDFARKQRVTALDLTGGAPELNPHFRRLVAAARTQGLKVIDRCNLTILGEPGQEDLADFLAAHEVEVVASLPCYLEENVDKQRGDGVFAKSLAGLRRLNALGYGVPGRGLALNLVYNPGGAALPPAQGPLEAAYKEQLATRYGVVFDRLYVLANMPIARFASRLAADGALDDYLVLLQGAHCDDNLPGVMCRSLVSVDWQGKVYDCDFNQMLRLPIGGAAASVPLASLVDVDLDGQPIRVAGHCYGCTAGQGSSCGGALAGADAADKIAQPAG